MDTQSDVRLIGYDSLSDVAEHAVAIYRESRGDGITGGALFILPNRGDNGYRGWLVLHLGAVSYLPESDGETLVVAQDRGTLHEAYTAARGWAETEYRVRYSVREGARIMGPRYLTNDPVDPRVIGFELGSPGCPPAVWGTTSLVVRQ